MSDSPRHGSTIRQAIKRVWLAERTWRALQEVAERVEARNGELDAPLHSFEELESRALRARFYRNVRGVTGWLSQRERRALYALARTLPGPFLEIGPWAGLSTSIIAYGIRDSAKPKLFITTELDPDISWWRPHNGKIGFFPPSSPTPSIPCGSSSVKLFERDIRPVAEVGIVNTLRANLDRLGLADLVTVLTGDFTVAPRHSYSWVFADTMHDPNEIEINAPRLRPYLKVGAVLACHDTTSANEAVLRKQLSIGRSFQVDSLFVGEIA